MVLKQECNLLLKPKVWSAHHVKDRVRAKPVSLGSAGARFARDSKVSGRTPSAGPPPRSQGSQRGGVGSSRVPAAMAERASKDSQGLRHSEEFFKMARSGTAHSLGHLWLNCTLSTRSNIRCQCTLPEIVLPTRGSVCANSQIVLHNVRDPIRMSCLFGDLLAQRCVLWTWSWRRTRTTSGLPRRQ